MTSKDKKVAGTLISSVDESYFSAEESKEILKSIKGHIGKSGEVPPFRLVIEDPELSKNTRDYFKDSQATITTVEEANKAVKILNRYRQQRGLYEIALAIDQALNSTQKLEIDQLMDKVSSKMASVRTSKQVLDNFLHFGRNSNSRDLVDQLLNGDPSEDTIPTGITPFDEQSGGFMRGSLVTLGASSGGGKSLMANQIAKNMAERGYKVVIVPLEMSKIEMTSRLLANLSKIDVTRILQKRLASGEKDLVNTKFSRWSRKVKSAGGRLTVYKPLEDVSIEDVFAAVASFDADVVIVDYISLLAGTDGDDSWQQLGAIARLAKINAEATNRVNVLLCQVSEDGKIRYARSISEHSTNSLIWVASKEEREKPVGRIKIEQPKARNSKSFPFEVGFDWAHMAVVPLDHVSSDVGDVAEPMKNLTIEMK
jgi:replicative DNA helicase